MRSKKKRASIVRTHSNSEEYDDVLSNISSLLERARRAAARSVNAVMTETYWEIGRRIVKYEQNGHFKAEYGHMVINQLSKDLSKRYGRGFGRRNLFQMRAFYLAYPEKVQAVPAQSEMAKAHQNGFPLPWTHYRNWGSGGGLKPGRFSPGIQDTPGLVSLTPHIGIYNGLTEPSIIGPDRPEFTPVDIV